MLNEKSESFGTSCESITKNALQHAPENAQNQATSVQKDADVPQKPLYSPYVSASAPPKEKPHFEAIDTLLSFLSLLGGVLLARAMPIFKHTLGGFLVMALLLSLSVAYLLHDKKKLPPLSWCIFGYAIVLSVGFLTGGNVTVLRWLVLILFLCLSALSCLSRGLAGEGKWSPSHLFCALCAIFSTPVTASPYLFPAMAARQGTRGRTFWKTVGLCALGVAAAAIPCTVIVAVLSYDAQFMALLERIFTIRVDGLGAWIVDLILGLLLALLLFGSMFGSKLRENRQEKDPLAENMPRVGFLPRALLCAFVTPILAVYAIFFVSQWSYYVSAFTHVLPEGLTFSEYARSGFFELCGVSAFNAALLFVFHILIKPKKEGRDRLKSVYTALISLFTLVLITTALSKMALYIDSYGLTEKRVYASWFMLLLAAVFLAVLLAQVVRRIRLSVVIPITCALFFALIAIPNVNAMIANYNVDAYLDGRLVEVDTYTISRYGASGVPALVKLENALQKAEHLTEQEKLRLQNASYTLNDISKELGEQSGAIFSFNFPAHHARQALASRAASPTR